MAGRGGLVAITDEQRRQLLAAEGDEQKIEVLDDFIGAVGEQFVVHLDKAWDPIHRVLAREDPEAQDFPPGSSDVPLELAIMGGKPLLEDEDASTFLMRLVEPDQVRQVAEALHPIDEATFRSLYDAHCRGAAPEFDDDGLEYAWEYFQAVREFYSGVADSGRTVVFDAGV